MRPLICVCRCFQRWRGGGPPGVPLRTFLHCRCPMSQRIPLAANSRFLSDACTAIRLGMRAVVLSTGLDHPLLVDLGRCLVEAQGATGFLTPVGRPHLRRDPWAAAHMATLVQPLLVLSDERIED